MMAEYRYRKNPRWQYSASLYRYRQTGDLAAETELNFDGVEVEVGSELDTLLTIDTYIFDAMYTLRRTDRSELTIGGGSIFSITTSSSTRGASSTVTTGQR